ncbi:hypothetical protein HSACCH_01722 [Halanaerobium saccharolyticum subsp. saccharolyticum DSM 6643]|uniref:Uncharacterized protein n=1 Tax=Halanaerobium saccharolyticum subsp. saccharolyticum DSM 6643 TaxID=1293054 RepID=M5E2R4_9FIRM|nr:hypothetical protein [Halanaerobium saccharolyticum]CCU79938.1 hypothetical protein HSACCH_01722 [Halanaerobium saccharolyticum subsp. saccharolyticum DSM 6643]
MKNRYLVVLTILFILTFTTVISADQIKLQNGQSFRGEIRNSSIKIRTSYAEISIQSRFLKNIKKEAGNFVFSLSENNRFSGELLDEITIALDSSQSSYSSAEIEAVNFSNTSSFKDNKAVNITTTNGDFFFANTVEDSISIKTSLGSPLNIKYSNISSIEYLNNENIYLINRKNASEIKANFSQQSLILWPSAGEIFELNLNYLQKLVVN